MHLHGDQPEQDKNEARFEVTSGPDSQGRHHFNVRWWDDHYHLAPQWRAQHFHAELEFHKKYWDHNGRTVAVVFLGGSKA
jgi:hypothetical protein